jgi:predicted neuraminidase
MNMPIALRDHDFLLPHDHALFACCHASSLVKLPQGDLLCAYFGGSGEGRQDTAIWLSRRKGGTWQMPRPLFAEVGLPHWNPVLHAQAGQTWIFYKVGQTTQDWTSRVARSDDGGRTWSDPQPLVPGDALPRGPMKNKLIVLTSGEWLAPGSMELGDAWDAFVDLSADFGRTWQRILIPFEHGTGAGVRGAVWDGFKANAMWQNDLDAVFKWDGIIQPALWESAPGRVHALLRSTRGRIYRSDSADLGRTWCPAYPTPLPNNNCGIDLARLPTGRLVLAYNPIDSNWGPRSPLSLACSDDNGATWSSPLHVETNAGEYSYPAAVAENDQVYLTYTWNRQNIVFRSMVVN